MPYKGEKCFLMINYLYIMKTNLIFKIGIKFTWFKIIHKRIFTKKLSFLPIHQYTVPLSKLNNVLSLLCIFQRYSYIIYKLYKNFLYMDSVVLCCFVVIFKNTLDIISSEYIMRDVILFYLSLI